ncbi:hypothetical protein [Plantactinospora sp. WMMB782]|uniref:hypothetical protein n=1 Tax=Plantactinospora sp. WMMB782 TaxID=3404121 RepID=UPI003B9457B2
MAWDAADLDKETLEKAAREALEQPSDSAMWDDRLYNTHGAVMAWAEYGDDILAESNYHAALEAIRGAAVHADDDPDEHVIDATTRHWAVGSLRQIFVQVYDDSGEFTAAFREATAIALYLREEYPILDESDYSERESKAFDAAVADAKESVERDYPDDSDEDRAGIWESMEEKVSERQGHNADGISWSWFEDTYAEHRNAYFQRKAEPFAATHLMVPTIPGQLALT